MEELLRGDFQRRIVFVDESALFAVFNVGELGIERVR
jgi:hypothetical protein